MGSLASRPKAPSVAQTVYVPAYSPATPAPSAPLPTGQADAPDTTPPSGTEEEQGSIRRNASLLERRRGMFSTVLTGFRGILSQTAAEPRKTLLGE